MWGRFDLASLSLGKGPRMALSDLSIRNAKPRDREYKLADEKGLYLLVTPSGGKLWRLKYRNAGVERKLSLGPYPDTSLAAARKAREVAREGLATAKHKPDSDYDPARERQRAKVKAKLSAENTFEGIAREYCAKRKRDGHKGWAPGTAIRCEYLLSRLYPSLGHLPIANVQPADMLAALRKIEGRGQLESARRTAQLAGAVFKYAVQTARLASDPTRDLRGALSSPTVTHYGAITDPVGAGELMRAVDDYQGAGLTSLALRLAPHVFVRPGELRHAEWAEIDWDKAVWTIPGSKTKMRKDHHVPLSRQAIAILREAELVGSSGFIFPSLRTRARPMSENTLNAALRRMGYTSDQMTSHGFRAMASTLLNECGKWSPDAIERALAHGDGDKVRAAYHRGAHWKERVEMAQWWSDHLDRLRKGADIVPFPEVAAK